MNCEAEIVGRCDLGSGRQDGVSLADDGFTAALANTAHAGQPDVEDEIVAGQVLPRAVRGCRGSADPSQPQPRQIVEGGLDVQRHVRRGRELIAHDPRA